MGTTTSIGGAALAAIWGIVKHNKKEKLEYWKSLMLILVRQAEQEITERLSGEKKRAEVTAKFKKVCPKVPDWLVRSILEWGVGVMKADLAKATNPVLAVVETAKATEPHMPPMS